MIFELDPYMMYMDPKDNFKPHLGHLKFLEVGVADRAHFWRFSVEPKLKVIRIF
jgi:hypothetical protein